MKKIKNIVKKLFRRELNLKMLRYHFMNKLAGSRKSKGEDDFDWKKYTLHYKGELELIQKENTLVLKPGHYEFTDNTLLKRDDIAPLHDNAQLLYETILQLNPESALEVGCGGGDNLHNIKTLAPEINVFGVDVSQEQLNLLVSRHSSLENHVTVADITRENFSQATKELVFTQAVLMHIGETGGRYLHALENVIKSSSRYVVLMENWKKHSVYQDVLEILGGSQSIWPEYFIYYRQSNHNPLTKLMVVSSTKLSYPLLSDYNILL